MKLHSHDKRQVNIVAGIVYKWGVWLYETLPICLFAVRAYPETGPVMQALVFIFDMLKETK